MKVIHLPFTYLPDPIGGTEVYVRALVQHLRPHCENVIAAPHQRNSTYFQDGVLVRRFAETDRLDLEALYGSGDQRAAREFTRILEEEQPDLVHLHAFTSGVSLRLVRAAKARHLPVVFTYHTPTVSCQRGTLLYMGQEICDGLLRPKRCTRCTLDGLGASRAGSTAISLIPPLVGQVLGKMKRSGGLWTALRMRRLVEVRQAAFFSLMDEVDQVVALCGWVQDLLVRNGVAAGKIRVSRHGLAQSMNRQGRPASGDEAQLKLVFLGRLDPTKGPHLVIKALQAIPAAPIQFDLYGITQGESGERYGQYLKDLAANDPRITFFPPVPGEQVVSLLQGYDLLVVPSQCLETGPLVVLEAFAAGVPVLGSNLGGIAEWVQNGLNGYLVEPDSTEAWREALQTLALNRTLVTKVTGAIQPPRLMSNVAEDMLSLYQSLCFKESATRLSKDFSCHERS